MEQVLTIAACDDFRRNGKAARVTRTMPTTLTSKTRCHSESALSSIVPCAPTPAFVDEDVQPAEFADEVVDCRADGEVVGDVCGSTRVLRGRVDLAVQHADQCALLAEQFGRRPTDSGCAARDDRTHAVRSNHVTRIGPLPSEPVYLDVNDVSWPQV